MSVYLMYFPPPVLRTGHPNHFNPPKLNVRIACATGRFGGANNNNNNDNRNN